MHNADECDGRGFRSGDAESHEAPGELALEAWACENL